MMTLIFNELFSRPTVVTECFFPYADYLM